ncbi:MAG: hypothetical protein KA807_01670 [Prolixibacteraceae bacterium]|nr:hypothetical protein [Prolixibacteraceae bacterium]
MTSNIIDETISQSDFGDITFKQLDFLRTIMRDHSISSKKYNNKYMEKFVQSGYKLFPTLKCTQIFSE